MANKIIHIIGGGTVSHIGSHLALCAPAYGNTAHHLAGLCLRKAGPDTLDTLRSLGS
jgi:hypothetical protein